MDTLQKQPKYCRCSVLGKTSDVSPGLCSCAQQGLSGRCDPLSGRSTPFPWPSGLATAAPPTTVSLHLIAVCVPDLQLLCIITVMIIISLPYINTYTCSHLSALHASMGSQTQDSRNSIKTRSISFMSKSQTATFDLLNVGRDQRVFALGLSVEGHNHSTLGVAWTSLYKAN